MTERPLLSIRDLVVQFHTRGGTVHAVNNVSFDIGRAETLGLVGESGCGKTTTGLAIMRLLPRPAGQIAGGQILLDGTDLVGVSEPEMRAIRGRDIGMIFQDPMTSLNPVFTVGDQLVETIRAHRPVKKQEARKRATELLDMVGIAKPEARLHDYPYQFSGGMRQRVMIAINLALEPQLIIADEPTSALDVTIQAQVLELLQRLTAERSTAVLLVTHDLGVVAGITQRVNVMYAGHIVEAASTGDIFGAPQHPYTVGLLHSIPRLDQPRDTPLTPIAGAPPDMRRLPPGCPFAPRCAWRIERCWVENPPLGPVPSAGASTTSHLAACWNPPNEAEAQTGRPLRSGFTAAPPPTGSVRTADRSPASGA